MYTSVGSNGIVREKCLWFFDGSMRGARERGGHMEANVRLPNWLVLSDEQMSNG